MLPSGILEYMFTIGIIISAVALIVGAIKDRKNIRETLGKYGFARRHFPYHHSHNTRIRIHRALLREAHAAPILRRCDISGYGT